MVSNWLGDSVGVPVLLAAAALALTALVGIVFWSRTQAVRRLRAVLDAHAEQEIRRRLQSEKKIYARRNLHARSQSQSR